MKAAFLYAAWNTQVPFLLFLASFPIFSIFDLGELIGPRGIAVMFAFFGALWRWYKYRLGFHAASSGTMLSCLMAFILGDANLPFVSSIVQNAAPGTVPMLNGLIVGLFGLVLISGIQDFMTAYIKKKAD